MCIAIPMQVIEAGPFWGWCQRDAAAACEQVDLRLVGSQPPGTWVLVFLGAAREVIDAQRAAQVRAALAALAAVTDLERGAGEAGPGGGETGPETGPQTVPACDLLFADLVGRTPQLPAWLRPPAPPDPSDDPPNAPTTP